MSFHESFTYYDPFVAEILPLTFPQEFNGIAQRARSLLVGFTQDDLMPIAHELHRVTSSYFLEGYIRSNERSEKLGDKYGSVTDVDTLIRVIENYPERAEKLLSLVTEIECFAVVALASIGEVAYEIHENPDVNKEWMYTPFTAEALAMATEAITYAEMLKDGMKIASKRSKQARMKRSNSANKVIRRLYDLHCQNAKSGSQAAHWIFAAMSSDERSLIPSTTDKLKIDAIRKRIGKQNLRKSEL